MKKILLGTTAFLAASVAMAAEAPTAKVTGSASANLQTVSQTGDNSGGTRSAQTPAGYDAGWNLNQESYHNEIHFTASGKTDAGLSYMAQVQHRFIGTPSTDEAFVEFSGDWGKLQLGQNDAPAGDNYIGGQSVLSGQGGWDGYSDLTGDIGANHSISSDDAKVVYYLPSIAGLNVGVSLSPQGGTVGNAAASGTTAFAAPSSPYRNALEASAQYTADLGGAKVTVGGTYGQATYNSEFATNTVVSSTNTQQNSEKLINNHRGYNVGAKVVVGALSVSAGHTNHGKGGITKAQQTRGGSARNNGTLTSLGVGYDLGGGTTVGLGMANSKTAIVANENWKGSATSTQWSAGVTTAVAPGLSVYGEFNTISGTSGKIINGGYRGNEVILGTRITF